MTHGRAALALALVLVASFGATAAEVAIRTPDGTPDPSATLRCADPPSAGMSDGCRRLRCESARWLPGEAPRGTPCVLRPAVRLGIELPQGVGGTLRVTVTPAGARAPAWRSGEPMPPLPTGRYDIEAARADGSWRCRATFAWYEPRPLNVFVPWREPKIVEGRVLTESGQPRSGVRIRIVAEESPGWRCDGDRKELVSSDDGSFRIAVDPEGASLGVAGGWDDPSGIAFAPAVSPLRLVPRPPHRATARVVDQDGRPVACHAHLEWVDEDERRIGHAPEASCDADGHFTVGPFAAASAAIDLRPVDALPVRLGVVAGPRTAVVDLGEVRIARGASLRVAVHDDRLHPIDGATVTAEGRVGLVVTRRAKTGVDGDAVITGLPTGARVGLTVEAAGFARFVKRGAPVGADEDVTLVPAEALRGRAVDPSGNGVHATVEASSREGTLIDRFTTDADGTFALTTLPEGVVLLQAEAPGYKPSQITSVADRSREVVLSVRDVDDIPGSVFDPTGAPIAGASVLLVRDALNDPPEAGAIAATRSAADGSFRLAGSGLPGAIVVAAAHGYAMAKSSATPPLSFVLGPEARLLVKARAHASIALVDATGLARTLSAGNGGALVDRLAPGPCSVSVGFRQEKTVDLVAGVTTEVTFEPGARVSGRVTANGRPSAQAVVALASAGPEGIGVAGGVRTDMAGSYAIEGAAPGSYVATAVAPEGRAERRIDLVEGGEVQADLDIIERTVRLLVRERTSGRPIGGAAVTVAPAGSSCTAFAQGSSVQGDIGWELAASNGGCSKGVTSDDGVVGIPLAQSGSYLLSVTATGFSPWQRSLDVIDGVSDLVAELQAGGPPRVRVLLDTMPPLLSGTLYCIHGGVSASSAPVSGEASCDGLPPGPAEVAFRADDLGLARAAVVVPESGEVSVTLIVAPAGRLVVPLAGAERTIRVLDGHGGVWNLPYGLGWPRCGIEGRSDFVCREIPPGAYSVEIDGKRRAPVIVRGGETSVAY